MTIGQTEAVEKRVVEPAPLRLRLSPDAALHVDEEGARVAWTGGTINYPALPAPLVQALRQLDGTGEPESALIESIVAQDAAHLIGRLYYYLNQLTGRGLVSWAVDTSGGPLLTLWGTSPVFSLRPRSVDAATRFALSRFTFVRREAKRLIVENPLQPAIVEATSWRAGALLARLAEPATVHDLTSDVPGLSAPEAAAAIQLLLNSGAVASLNEDGDLPEELDDTLIQWNPYDLLFHARSRFGRHLPPFGAGYRHAGRIAPQPAVRPPREGAVVALSTPDLELLRRVDRPFTDVLESRVSARTFGEQPISKEQLGTFLFRVGRVRSEFEHDVQTPAGPIAVPVTSRPYPSGGASYEIEFYITVDRCDGLDRGLYHYDPRGHSLTLVRAADELVERLLWYPTIAAPGSSTQVVITLAARFQRVNWKYDAIAYTTIQKNVGIIYQTMYLVATAMELGSCALGSGDADLFAQAAEVDYLVEGSVGDFLLGSLPHIEPGEPAR